MHCKGTRRCSSLCTYHACCQACSTAQARSGSPSSDLQTPPGCLHAHARMAAASRRMRPVPTRMCLSPLQRGHWLCPGMHRGWKLALLLTAATCASIRTASSMVKELHCIARAVVPAHCTNSVIFKNADCSGRFYATPVTAKPCQAANTVSITTTDTLLSGSRTAPSNSRLWAGRDKHAGMDGRSKEQAQGHGQRQRQRRSRRVWDPSTIQEYPGQHATGHKACRFLLKCQGLP